MHTVIESLNAWGDQFVRFAGLMLAQSVALMAVLLALDWVLRKRARAVIRYTLLSLVLVKLVLPPSLALPTGVGYWVSPAPGPGRMTAMPAPQYVPPAPPVAPRVVGAAASRLYLVINNGAHTFSLTAYNTAPAYSYRVETNADISNPAGWAPWMTLTATDSVTPLSSLSTDYKEMFFRAVVLGPSDAGTSNTFYLGHVENASNAEGNALLSEVKGWGRVINPDKDGSVALLEDGLTLAVPGGSHPHDLAADIGLTNAPRIVQSVTGDFTIEVKTDGRFDPGDISTQPGRHAYNGAALIVMADPDNVVTLARAGLQYPQETPAYYANFEIRAAGRLQRIGMSGDFVLPATGPVFLRLQKKGAEVIGSVSLDGKEWNALGTKQIPSTWPQTLSAGVAAISTTEARFAPHFSKLSINVSK